MHKKEELQEKFSYKKVKKIVNDIPDYHSIKSHITFRTEKRREIDEFIEWVRDELIDNIMKREAKGEKIDNFHGTARDFIDKRIYDFIKGLGVSGRYIEREELFEGRFGSFKGIRKIFLDPVQSSQALHTVSFEQKKIILECSNRVLTKDQKDILQMIFYQEKETSEIGKKLGWEDEVVRKTKRKALEKLRKALTERLGPEIVDFKGRLHDISIWQDIIDEHPQMLKPRKITSPPTRKKREVDEETKEYIDMLLHTIHDVVKIIPISDMMDEYLYGKLEGVYKELFEKHLMECDECYDEFNERFTLLTGLVAVLHDTKIRTK